MEASASVGDEVAFSSSLIDLIGLQSALELLQKSIVILEKKATSSSLTSLSSSTQLTQPKQIQKIPTPKMFHTTPENSPSTSSINFGGDIDIHESNDSAFHRIAKLSCELKANEGSINFEVLDTVFGYLDFPTLCKASEVCVAWRSFALDPSFWSRFKDFSPLSFFTLPLYSTSTSPRPHHHHQQNNSSQPQNNTINNNNNNNKFDLGKTLKLSRFSQLHTLDLSPWKDIITDEWIVQNVIHLPTLRHLSLFNCTKVDFTHNDLSKLSSLTSLNLGASQVDQQISNASLEIVKYLTNLRTLNLHYCEKINNYGIPHITKPPLPKLQYLDLGNCFRLSSSAVSDLLSLSPTLTWLSLRSPIRSNTFIKDDALAHLSKFSRLTYLDVGYCKKITDEGMVYLSELDTLQHFSIASTHISDDGVRLLQNLKYVKSVDITNCKLSTDAAMFVTSYPMLQSVILRGIPLGNDRSWNIASLANCTNLQELDLANTYLNDEALSPQYCKQMTSLTTLNISYCSNLTVETAFNVCSFLPFLKTLSISHCYRMTDQALSYLLLAKNLTRVDVSGIGYLTNEALIQLANVLPDLKIINNR